MAKRAKNVVDSPVEEEQVKIVVPADLFDGFQEITEGIAGFWNPAPGDAIRGTLIGYRDDIGAFTSGCWLVVVDFPAIAYPKDDPDAREGDGIACQPGETVAVWNSYNLALLEKCDGLRVGIQYKGREKTKTAGRTVKLYRLFVQAGQEEAMKLRAPMKRTPMLPDGKPNLAAIADQLGKDMAAKNGEQA